MFIFFSSALLSLELRSTVVAEAETTVKAPRAEPVEREELMEVAEVEIEEGEVGV
jgi:hypothetical protein